MGWFGGLFTRKSQGRTEEVYDYRVHHEEDQSVRSMKLPICAYSTETSAAVGAWVLLERNGKQQAGGAVGVGGQNSQLGDSQAGGEKTAASSWGRALTPSVHHADQVD